MNPYLMERCWNKVRMTKWPFRLNSLTNLPGSKFPNCGSKGAKSCQNRLLITFSPHKSAQSAYFGLEGVEKDGLQQGASRKIGLDFSPQVLFM